jgi:hypothetical protein
LDQVGIVQHSKGGDIMAVEYSDKMSSDFHDMIKEATRFKEILELYVLNNTPTDNTLFDIAIFDLLNANKEFIKDLRMVSDILRWQGKFVGMLGASKWDNKEAMPNRITYRSLDLLQADDGDKDR